MEDLGKKMCAEEMAQQEKTQPQAEQVNFVKLDRCVSVPEYWKKRIARMKDSIKAELNEAAKSSPVCSDEHGEYRKGTFLYKSFIVHVDTTAHEDGNVLWSAEIYGEHPVTLPIIKEIRYKYIPDSCLMVQVFPPRAKVEDGCVVLYQIPSNKAEE